MRIGKDWEDGLVLEGWAGLEGLNRGAGLAGWNIKDGQNGPLSFRPTDFKTSQELQMLSSVTLNS